MKPPVHVPAPRLPGVYNDVTAARAALAMAVPFVPELWMVWA